LFNVVSKDAPRIRLLIVEVYHHRIDHWGRLHRSHISVTSSTSGMEPHMAVCLAEVLGMCAVFCEALDQDIETALQRERERVEKARAEREAERERLLAERKRLAEEAEKPLAELKEWLKWNLDEQIKMKWRGRRSIVFGTVRRIDTNRWGTTYLYTISERGNPMEVRLNDIVWLDNKPEDSHRYVRIFTHPDQSSSR
jgi:hypothetical protein